MSESLFQTELIRAGAGAGKTHQLIEKIYRLFEKSLEIQKRAPRLIVCTFTRKASQELKERLFEKSVESLAVSSPLALKNSFLSYISSSSLQIGTIDSILYHLLKKYGHEIELNPDFEVSSEVLNSRLFDSFSDEFLYKRYFSLLRQMPYPDLKERLLAYYRYRIQYGKLSFYDEKDFKEFQKERDFFKEKTSPNELKEDIKKNFQKKSSIYQMYLKSQALEKRKKQTHKAEERLKTESKILSKSFDYESLKKLFKEEEIFKSALFLPLFQEFQAAAEEFFIEFLKRKKNSPELSIEDLLLFSLYLLESKTGLSKQINQDWDYWLIDEYQDTSLLQDQIIEKITQFKNVFCVGDPGQSIYAFRGADPTLFRKREEELIKSGGIFKELKINRRSSPALISFYNDFFPEERFIKFEPVKLEPAIKLESSLKPESSLKLNSNLKSDPDIDLDSLAKPAPDPKKELKPEIEKRNERELKPKSKGEHEKSCLSFFTYDLEDKKPVLKTLLLYIKKLQREQGASYSDIAVLCSKNEDLITVSNYLKERAVPLLSYSSKKISQNRVVLDSLFLLKFLINPYDDNNLKALLRTPYFRLSDQELANRSHEYKKLSKNFYIEFKNSNPSERGFQKSESLKAEPIPDASSFWAFIKDKYKGDYFVESLSFYLKRYKSKGLFEGFKQALFDSGIMDLADFQDPTESSSASLWKLLSLLKKSKKSPLNLFYDLTEKRAEDPSFDEPAVQEKPELMELMTIHKSKGLQFKHVIVLDFSMPQSVSEAQLSDDSIYDPFRKKISFSVPLGARHKRKIKNYGHKAYNMLKREEKIREKDHLFYVAMTRAEQSLALFIPQGKSPQKNSWLSRADYFQKVENLLNKEKKGLWFLNSGLYDRGSYLLTVENCQELSSKESGK